ncbi:family 16 glycosylhydrolase [Algoriphagus sp. NG3]|uniref:family 16 glycosylhydrolase n=1 Tax=Algoriphagus sp. NG3 TaxID=3097546 RepID=UPI002A837D66|nr:family 16 glycosylhydrolase [Algoriphagus sp. NG3]WPR73370.1 family 16 glycosylhydrolase [Algoriphagus sp. NG3]
MKLFITSIVLLALASCSNSQDQDLGTDDDQQIEEPVTPETELGWKDIPVPAEAGENKVWEFQELSDDFHYQAPADGKSEEFLNKWDDFYHNQWAGPGLTEWRRNHSMVEDGLLQMIAARKPDSDKILLGCITSKTRVSYPVYVEAYAKVMNSTLASDVWLLSPDDTQEIDIVEAYGATYSESAQENTSWYAERIHVSHHVFVRNPFQDYQPTDSGSWYRDGTIWKEEFHRYGVYWKDPWHLEYYIDGKLVRTVSGKEMIDPKFYTNAEEPGNSAKDTRTGLSKEMDIIINVEDQTWRSSPASGLQSDTYTPTDSELAKTEDHTFIVDWIRVYKPVDKN